MANQQQPQSQEMKVAHAGGLDLPPGFRFHPSDFEIVNHYLMNKVRNRDYTCIAIGEVELNKTEPWDLPRMAKLGDKEWYFFYQKDRKYPTGLRANRATEAGYWKATGRDKEVYDTTEAVALLIGMKKTLVFYEGRAPRGHKTNWMMHEYRLKSSGRLPSLASTSNSVANAATMQASSSASKGEWVVCRVFETTTGMKKITEPSYEVAMDGAEIEQNQDNIPAISIPMPLQLPLPLPLPVPMPMHFPTPPDFAMDPVDPYYPNASAAMSPMVGIGDVDGLQINDALFGNSIVVPPQMNLYHQMGMGGGASQMGMAIVGGQMNMGVATSHMGIGSAVAQMDMGATGTSGFDVAAPETRLPSSIVAQKDEQANSTEISSMMSATGPGSMTTSIEMDDIWKYIY